MGNVSDAQGIELEKVFNVETKTISATHDVYIVLCLPRQSQNKNAHSTIQHRWNRANNSIWKCSMELKQIARQQRCFCLGVLV